AIAAARLQDEPYISDPFDGIDEYLVSAEKRIKKANTPGMVLEAALERNILVMPEGLARRIRRSRQELAKTRFLRTLAVDPDLLLPDQNRLALGDPHRQFPATFGTTQVTADSGGIIAQRPQCAIDSGSSGGNEFINFFTRRGTCRQG
ncbi:MAG: hypothetical protein PVH32_07295, partial [Chromatiales bacterium]